MIILSFQAGQFAATIITSLVMITAIYAFQAIDEPIERYCDLIIRQRLNHWFDSKNIYKISKIEYTYLENSKDLDLINRVTEATGDEAVDFFSNCLKLFSGIITIIGTFVLLSTYNPIIAIAVIIVAIPIMIIAAKYGKTIHDWYQKSRKKRRWLDYLSSIFTDRDASVEIKGYGFFDYLNHKWSEQYKDLRNQDFKLQIKAWKNTVVSSLLLNMFEYVTYIIMLMVTVGGTITIGAFIGLSKAIANIEGLILWQFSALFTFFSNSAEYWRDYNKFLNLPEIADCKMDSLTNSAFDNDANDSIMEFRNVSFRYENMENDLLNNVSFKINSRETVGLVGINGAGKSTITKIMLGLYKPNSGDIFINNRNTKEMPFSEQAGYFGITYQDFIQYNLSVLENIGLPSEPIDRTKVQEILNQLEFDYESLPMGLDTVLGRKFGNGVELSGGEWQKIALARMLYSDKPFYIMDEPTASLDPISEVVLYKLMKTVLSDKPSLMITHRLGATVICDRIMVLDNGKIEESGSFSELMERGGKYAKMFNEQKQWYTR